MGPKVPMALTLDAQCSLQHADCARFSIVSVREQESAILCGSTSLVLEYMRTGSRA